MIRYLYLGCTGPEGGIYRFELNPESNRFTYCDSLRCGAPLYMLLDGHDLDVLLVRPFEGSPDSGVKHGKINSENLVELDDGISDTLGVEGCYLSKLDGKLYVANYSSSSFTRMPDLKVQREGKGPNPVRQEMAHPHSIRPTPDGKYLVACDLGTDEVLTYDRDLKLVSSCHMIPGSGPRFTAFSEDGKFAYVSCEMFSCVSVLRYDDGKFTLLGSYDAIPETVKPHSTASSIRCLDGKVYVGNRGDNSISVFRADGDRLVLEERIPVSGAPRDFDFFGNLLITANESGTPASVIDLKSGKTIQDITGIPNAMCLVAH